MVYSMAALLIPIVIGLGVWHYISSDHQVTVVDPTSAVRQARQSDLSVARPQGLADGWKTTSARTTVHGHTVTLRIGYVAPSGGFAQLVESNADSAHLLADAVPEHARPAGAESIAGHQWSRYRGRKNHEVLALLQPHRTILVVGQTDDAELRALTASITP